MSPTHSFISTRARTGFYPRRGFPGIAYSPPGNISIGYFVSNSEMFTVLNQIWSKSVKFCHQNVVLRLRVGMYLLYVGIGTIFYPQCFVIVWVS